MEDLALPCSPVRDVHDRLYGFAPALISIPILRKHERQAARPPSSFLSPLATIFSELSASGLCSSDMIYADEHLELHAIRSINRSTICQLLFVSIRGPRVPT